MIKLRDIRKPPARRTRVKAAIPMTGERPSLTPRRPNWVRWRLAPNGRAVASRIPGFMNAVAPAGHVPEGSPEEAAMKQELGL